MLTTDRPLHTLTSLAPHVIRRLLDKYAGSCIIAQVSNLEFINDFRENLPFTNPEYDIPPSETDIQSITQRLEAAGVERPHLAVLLGNAALQLTLGDRGETPQDRWQDSLQEESTIEISVDIDTYRQLSTNGWTRPEGVSSGVFKDGILATMGGQAIIPHEALASRSWKANNSNGDCVRVSNLADITTELLSRYDSSLESDQTAWGDLVAIREHLLNPENPPLPEAMLTREIEAIRSTLPADLRHAEEAQPFIRVAANGLLATSAMYGDRDIRIAQPIYGDYEHQDHKIRAFYHNAFDLLKSLRLAQKHFDNLADQGTPVDTETRLATTIAIAYADYFYGYGRITDNPHGHDELLSAQIAYAHTLQATGNTRAAERVFNAVYGTTFVEGKTIQRGWYSDDPAVYTTTAVDLALLYSHDSQVSTVDLAVEDMLSARYDRNRVLDTFGGHPFASVEGALEAIEEFADTQIKLTYLRNDGSPSKTRKTTTLREVFAARIKGSAWFHRDYKAPKNWTFNTKKERLIRLRHAQQLDNLADRFLRREITTFELYTETKRNAARWQNLLLRPTLDIARETPQPTRYRRRPSRRPPTRPSSVQLTNRRSSSSQQSNI
jgi:hypothetical protein